LASDPRFNPIFTVPSSHPMPHRLPVAILGFGAFERQALESAFRTSVAHAARYRVVATLEEARLVIADTDDLPAVQQLRAQGRFSQSLCIGASAPDEAAAWMMRPVDAAKALQLLDSVAARSGLASVSQGATPRTAAELAAASEPDRRRATDPRQRPGDRRS
jgi:hypothetical protein